MTMIKLALLLCCNLFITIVFAQKTDKKLQSQLIKAIQGFRGDVGIYIKELKSGKVVAINADTVFPTASIVKVPILIGVMDKIEKESCIMTLLMFIKIHYCMKAKISLAHLRTEKK